MANGKNCILITMDAVRADHLSCYGYHRDTTPNIDAFARRRFDKAFANGPRTISSFLSLIGGIYPLSASKKMTMPSDVVPLQGAFKGSGYSTAGFHSNPFLARHMGYGRDFDVFFDSVWKDKGSWENRMLGEIDFTPKVTSKQKAWHKAKSVVKHSPRLYSAAKGVRSRVKPPAPPFVLADGMNQKAYDFLEKAEEPFFMWMHYMDTHSPYLAKPGNVKAFTGRKLNRSRIEKLNNMYRERHPGLDKVIDEVVDLYDTKINDCDAEVGRLLDGLDEAGFLKGSIVAITSDHGEEFLENGDIGHHDRFYENNLRVPLVFNTGSGVESQMVGLIDLPPSLCRYSGIDLPSTFMGGDLDTGREAVITETWAIEGWRASIRTDRWKLHWYKDVDRIELYDLKDDPGEQVEISSDRTKLVDALCASIEEHVQSAMRTSVDRTVRSVDV